MTDDKVILDIEKEEKSKKEESKKKKSKKEKNKKEDGKIIEYTIVFWFNYSLTIHQHFISDLDLENLDLDNEELQKIIKSLGWLARRDYNSVPSEHKVGYLLGIKHNREKGVCLLKK